MNDATQTDRMPRMEADNGWAAEEVEQLRELYAELPGAAEAAAELLGDNGPMLTGMRLERLMELQARVVSLVLEIEKLLTR